MPFKKDVTPPQKNSHKETNFHIHSFFVMHAVFLTNLSCSRTWPVFMSSQNEYGSRIQLTKLNEKPLHQTCKIWYLLRPTRYHLRKCAYFINTCSISGYLYGHVCDGWYSEPLCRALCRYVGSKKCFMVPLSLIIIIPKLILSTTFFSNWISQKTGSVGKPETKN